MQSSINTLLETFLSASDDILKHYNDQFHIIQNPTYLIQSLPPQDLENIKKTIQNHADITSSDHSMSLNILTLLKMSHTEIFTDSHEKILYLMVIIPLFDPTPHKILSFSHNRLFTQPVSDSHSFSSLDFSTHKYTHDHDLLITDRRLNYRRKSVSFEDDLNLASQSNLIDDVIFITRIPQTFTINCGNRSTSHKMSQQLALAIHLPHDCSLSSEYLHIPTHNYHASISITQAIHIKRLKINSAFSTLPTIHKQLVIANLTDLSLFNDAASPSHCELESMTWIKISALCLSSSFIFWIFTIISFVIKGCYASR